MNGTTITNQARVDFRSASFGTVFDDRSNEAIGVVTVAPVLAANKNATLVADTNGDGVANPGDELRFDITISNTGTQAATAIGYDDTPGAGTTLIPGSVTTSTGTVTSGNGGADRTISTTGGSVPVAGSATVSYRVRVDNPLPEGLTGTRNQGRVRSAEVPPVLTNDPRTGPASDPTATPLVAAPTISASKSVSLSEDVGGNGIASPGDALACRITVTNAGTRDATATVADDVVDTNAPSSPAR